MGKKAIVLSGGGSRGAWQLGVLKKLMGEQKKDYEIMCGISVGALNVATLGMFPYQQGDKGIEFALNFWKNNVNTNAIYKSWFPLGVVHGLWKNSLYDSRPVRELFRKTFDYNLLKNSNRKIAVGSVNINTGQLHYIREDNDKFGEFVLASSSFPVFFSPIRIDGDFWTDGGVKEMTPLGQAIKMGADEIDVLITDHEFLNQEKWEEKSIQAIPDQLTRTLKLLLNELSKRDIQITGLKNSIANYSDKYKHVKVRILAPSKKLPGNSLNFDHKNIMKMIEIGYEDADKFIEYKDE